MAPFRTGSSATAAEDDLAGYAFLKPSILAASASSMRSGRRRQTRRLSAPQPHWLDTCRSLLGALVRLLLVAAVGIYVFGQVAISTPVYSEQLRWIIADWWGIPGADGHVEMVVPTYFVLFGVLPVLLSLLLAETVHELNLRRISSTLVLRIAAFLRRKPRIFTKWICWFSFGELLFLAALVGGNGCVFYNRAMPRLQLAQEAHDAAELLRVSLRTPLPLTRYLKIFAVALGFNSVFNMAFLFLPATRNCAWMEVLNISYANGIKYHRWLGVLTIVTAVGHCAGFYWAWLLEGTWRDKCLPCFDCDLDSPRGRRVWLNVFGELALLIFVVIGVTSVPFVRRKMYDLFYYVHQLFLLSVVFLIMHWEPSIWWLVPTVAVYIVSRSLSSANSFTPVQVKEFTTLDNDIVKIVINRSTNRDGDYKVGQFVYLNVPSISKLQWHAFTIGSSPRTNATTLTILLKSLGDWTTDLVHYSEDCKKNNVLPTVFMDGYYGASLEMYDEYPTVCLVGGGIGVTPLFAILEDMVVKLTNGVPMTQRVYFIFTFRELSLLEELHPLLMRLRELDSQEKFFTFHLSLTRAPSQETLRRCLSHDGSHRDWDSRPVASQMRAGAFAHPIASRKLKSFVYFTVLLYATSALVYLEFTPSEGSDSDEPSLWPLKYFMKALALLLCAVVVLFFVVGERVLEKWLAARALHANTSPADFYERLLPEKSSLSSRRHRFADASPLLTMEDLLHEYSVEVGRRPNMRKIVTEVHRAHVYSSSTERFVLDTIGVFVSGPKALKSATAHAIAEIGSAYFDIHEEEFEL